MAMSKSFCKKWICVKKTYVIFFIKIILIIVILKYFYKKFISEIDTLKLSVKKIAVIMQTDIEECILRDKKRIANRRVGSTVIRKLNDVLEFPHENEGFDLLLKIKGQNENYKENFKVPIINV